MFGGMTLTVIIVDSNKTSKSNEILLEPFPGTYAKAMKHYANPDLEKSCPQKSCPNPTLVPLAFEYHRKKW